MGYSKSRFFGLVLKFERDTVLSVQLEGRSERLIQ